MSENKYRIRKLTPRECWRLMGFSTFEDGKWNDECFEKAEAVNSNTQLYKQAGNSIVVDCLENIFRNLPVMDIKKEEVSEVIVYKDRAFCYQDCGLTECTRNKQNIEWDNQLPVSFMKCSDCVNWEPYGKREQKDYYDRSESEDE